MARVEAQKALELDPSLPEAYAMLGIIAASFDFDWKAAEQHCRRALSEPALSPWMRAVIGNVLLLPTGRTTEAVEQGRLALQQDPLHPGIRPVLAYFLMFQGRFAEAEAHLRQTLKLHPNNPPARYYLATVYTVRDMYREALSLVKEIPPSFTAPAPFFGLLAGLLVQVGEKDQAEELLRQFASGDAPNAAPVMITFYNITGDVDQAAVWAEKGIEQRLPGIVAGLTAGVIAKPLRESSYWPRLAKLMNLPEIVG
jgi:Tfp pilus assembly protein PilF